MEIKNDGMIGNLLKDINRSGDVVGYELSNSKN